MIRDVEVREAPPKGLGVFALRAFKPGEFIFRRRHREVLGSNQIERLSPEDRMHLCELDRQRCAVLLPPGCYLNHSCDPNAMRTGVKVSAWRTIAAGDEVTIDYRLNAFDGDSWPCSCQSPTCSGTVVGSFFALSPERQREYLPYAPPFIRREWRERATTTQGPSTPKVDGPASQVHAHCGSSCSTPGKLLKRLSKDATRPPASRIA